MCSEFLIYTVLTIALADAITNDKDYGQVMKEYYHYRISAIMSNIVL